MAPVPTLRSPRSLVPVTLVALAVFALLLTACGGGSEKANGVASLGGNASTTTPPKQAASTDVRTAWLAAAACMRKQGVDFPDPTFDANGRPQFAQNGTGGERGPGSIFRSNDPKITAARTACSAEFAKIRAQRPQLSAAEAAQRKQQILALAACMRGQGIDFPDPTFDANGRPQFGQGGQGGPGQGGTGTDRRDDPAFQKAMQTCRSQLGITFGPGGGNGAAGAPSTTARTGSA